jgi:hypothetical protein
MLFILSFVCFGFAMALMALGVLLGRRPLSGGCGRGADCACERFQ